ncbi:pyrroloquinoline quinone biosynthesis protein PqqE [Actinomadura rubteroloni]|uniref:Pyrroloquinoline quinone biosynthesis protein PqqE n=1 Tax=Actinomadura rubteroloni TaxID=1926885 RepID=A0A2P4UMD8_9ACTN|nr:radical SAM protein [Actinomadura rubteroloni]POM26212.1 pyrroloquinoline quinone biosynthesis protein PqqE [Actinomadura rubteroloni]
MTAESVVGGRKTLSIMPTFTCTAACADCGTLSSPRVRERISLDVILSAITQAHRLGFANVVFTGGEATLRWRDLLAGLSHARALGLPTRLVTNAHWAATPDRARDRLRRLKDAGLDEINYSTGDEHVRFVPVERVVHASVEAVRLGLPVVVMVELRRERAVTATTIREHPLVTALGADAALVRTHESAWMPLDPGETGDYPAGSTTDAATLPTRRGCDHVLQTYTVQADGRVGSCCGLGLRTIPELNTATAEGGDFLDRAVTAAEDDFLKLWLHYFGPERVLAWAAEKDPSIDWEGRYAHPCQACGRLYKDERVRTVLREHYAEMVAIVLQSAWLDDHYTPRMLAD